MYKNTKLTKVYILVVLTSLLFFSCKEKKTTESNKPKEEAVEVNYLEESKEDFDERMTWWRNDKFGMFIHWGPYAVPAGMYKGKEVPGIGEWIMEKAHIPIKEYEEFSKQFNPQKFDAVLWAKLMKEAGVKYVVITSKHHDGFGLWNSKVSDYDIVDYSPYGKDILKQLSEACKKEGIKFGLYHSIMDWHHPQAQAINEPNYNEFKKTPNFIEYREDKDTDERVNPEFQKYVEGYFKPQLKELIENYDPAILWFDGEWIPEYTHENGQDIYQYVRSLKPDILINNRVDIGRKGMMGMNDDSEDYAGDFGTPEQEILEGAVASDWESCMTMNDTWGFKKNDHNWKSTNTLLFHLIDVAAKGGNYLLNIGPKADGTIPQPSIDRLKEIGKWLSVNNEAIYNTEKLEHYKEGEDIRYTKSKGKNVFYAISLKQPETTIVFKNVKPNTDSEIHLLGTSTSLEWEFVENEGVTITVPQNLLNNLGETQAWVFKITGEEVK